MNHSSHRPINHQQQRVSAMRWLQQHPGQLFVLTFLALNGLLFLPLYLLNLESSSLWPLIELNGVHWVAVLKQLVIGRENFDPFRFNIELFLWMALWVNIRWLRRPGFRHLFALLYFIILLYYIYEAVTVSLYQSEPIFYSHYYLALDGLGYLFAHLNLAISLYLMGLLLLIVACWLVYQLALLLYQTTLTTPFSLPTRVSVAAVAILMLLVLGSEQRALASPTMVFSSLSYKVEENIEKSLALYQEVQQYDDTDLREVYEYRDFQLTRKPNLYLIMIESYGSVLYKRPDYRLDYAALTKQLKRTLDEGGMTVASALSESPTWGGGSWLAYTSTQFGLHLDNHPQYLALLETYQRRAYPHLGVFLQREGYQSYRLSALSADLSTEDWQAYENFYNVDRWFRFEDLAYQGDLYGWGPAPPDQYALSATRAEIAQRAPESDDSPFFLFFITQNSHYPFAPIPPLVDDWQTMNEGSAAKAEAQAIDDEERDHDVRRQDYFAAIDYQLNFLTQFILEHRDEEALFLLVGDHQPPRVSRRADGYDTPIHVVSRDANLVAAFYEYGFAPGLWVNPPEPTMRHEGLYSMLVRILVANGNPAAPLPPYLPDGFLHTTSIDEQ